MYLFTFVIFLLAGCNFAVNDEVVMVQGNTMGTSYSVQVVNTRDNKIPDQLVLDIKNILNSIDKAMSTWREDSELSKLNKKDAGEWIPVSDDLFAVLKLANLVSDMTNGAFDITLDPLIELWGFSSNEIITTLPAQEKIIEALQSVGYQHLVLNDKKTAIKKKIPLRINLSAIAKGFAVDKIAEHLNRHGIKSYLIEVGGELRLKGSKPGGVSWNIAIATPSVEQAKPYRLINLFNHAVATSGDYRNYYELQGTRYSHTISSITGHPVTHNLASVTVIDKSAATADALATALMVLGTENGYVLCEENNIPAYFIYKKNGKFMTRYTKDMIKYLPSN